MTDSSSTTTDRLTKLEAIVNLQQQQIKVLAQKINHLEDQFEPLLPKASTGNLEVPPELASLFGAAAEAAKIARGEDGGNSYTGTGL